MTDEDFEREVESLVENLYNLRLIKDKGRRPWLKKIIRAQVAVLLKD